MAGEILKKRREELGLELKEIAAVLKIRTDYLSAIENDLFDKLPVPVYTVGYIKCYARHLEIDAEAVVQYYTSRLSQPKQPTIIPVAYSQKKSPVILSVFSAILGGCLVFAIGFIVMQRSGRKELVAPDQAQGLHVGDFALTERSAGGKMSLHDNHSIDIAAQEKTWVQIKFHDGRAEEILMEPGSSKRWSFSGNASLKIGNAGGVRLYFDGNEMGSPGSTGQVKTLHLPDRAQL